VGNSLLTWETVNESSFGATRILTNSIGQQALGLELPGFSVGLLSVRTVGSTTPSSVASSASYSTEAGSLQTGGTNRAQTIFQFPALTGKEPAAVFLKLKGNSPAPQAVPIHLYRLTALPDEAALKSGLFPFRKKDLPQDGEPSLTVEGVGKNLQWVGGFTVESGAQETWVDITQAVARAKGGPLAWVLTRDRRQAEETLEGEPVEWQAAELLVYAR